MSNSVTNRNCFYVISFVIGFCAAGSLCGFWGISEFMVGGGAVERFVFFAVVFGSVYAGLMSPQWLIRLLTVMAGRARWLLTRQGRGQDRERLWLPGGGVDIQVVSIALAGSILLWSFISIGPTLLGGSLENLQDWFGQRFFLGVVALRILDIGLLVILLFPVWVLGGIMLVVLYRLALSIGDETKQAGLENKLPALLMLGLGAGVFCWGSVVAKYTGACLLVWLSHLVGLGGALFLIVFLPVIAGKSKNINYESGSVLPERVAPGRTAVIMIIVFCGAMIGVWAPLWKHLSVLIPWGGGDVHTCLFLAVLAVGSYFAGRGGGLFSSVRANLAVALLVWSGLCLSGVAVLSAIWLCFRRIEHTDVCWFLIVGLWAIVLAKTAVLGSIITYSKRMAQELAISRSLGWAFWLGLLGAGIILGWYVGVFIFLPRYGSLMVVLVLILASLMVSGLMAIYQSEVSLVSRRVIILAGFVLVACSSFVVPWAARNWLCVSVSRSSAIVSEGGDGAWALLGGSDNGGVQSLDLRRYWQDRCLGDFDSAQGNYLRMQKILASKGNKRVLMIGFEENLWPLPQAGDAIHIDYLLNRTLAGRLRRYELARREQFFVAGRSGANIIDIPVHLWLRCNQNRYDLIWLRFNDMDGRGHRNDVDIRRWRQLRGRLASCGIMLVQFDCSKGQTFSSFPIAPKLSAVFGPYGGILYPTASLAKDKGTDERRAGAGVFLVVFAGEESWNNFLRVHRYPFDLISCKGRPITIQGINGLFTRF